MTEQMSLERELLIPVDRKLTQNEVDDLIRQLVEAIDGTKNDESI